MRSLLAERDFRILLGGQYIAQAADGVAQAALANVLILEPRGNDTPGRILAVFALTLIPYSVVAPFMGVFVDRWARRGLLVATNLTRAAALGILALVWSAFSSDAPLYAAALILLGVGRLFLTTKGASLPFVLHERDLLRGNAVSSGGGMISALTGGALGVLAIGRGLGPRSALLVAAAMYALSSATVRRLTDPMAHPEPASERTGEAVARMARALVDGVREVWRRPTARLPLSGIFVLRTIGMLTVVAAIVVIKARYPGAADEGGRLSASALALGTAGAGAFLGALAAPRLNRKLDKPRLVLLGFVVSGTGIVALGGIEVIGAVLALTAIGGFGAFTAKVATDALVQEAMPDELRGRAFALYDILYNLASVVAALVLVAFSGVSLRSLLVTAGVACLLLAAALGAAMRHAGLLTATRT